MEENGQKQPKTIFICHHMQCIFDPKMAKARIFSDTTLPFDDPKQLSQDSDQVLDKSDVRFRRKCPKTWFLTENGQILEQTSTPSDGPPLH